jgi:hypothetical protein
MSEENTDLLEVLEYFWQTKIKNVHTAMPCEVVKLDSEKWTVSVKPHFKSVFKGDKTEIEMPVVNELPIGLPRTATSVDFHPIGEGDIGWMMVSERSIAEWNQSKGETIFPKENRQFDFTDSFFLLGGYPAGNPVTKTVPEKATGKIVDNGTKLFFGRNEPQDQLALNGIPTDVVSILSKVVEYLNLVNNNNLGGPVIQDIPHATVAANLPELQQAIDSLKVT